MVLEIIVCKYSSKLSKVVGHLEIFFIIYIVNNNLWELIFLLWYLLLAEMSKTIENFVCCLNIINDCVVVCIWHSYMNVTCTNCPVTVFR